jgi:hypothetical protein
MSDHEITFNTDLSERTRTRADFTCKISPAVILITDTGLGSPSVADDIGDGLTKNRILAPRLDQLVQNHVQRWQWILAQNSLGRQNDILFRSRRNRRAKGAQEWVLTQNVKVRTGAMTAWREFAIKIIKWRMIF